MLSILTYFLSQNLTEKLDKTEHPVFDEIEYSAGVLNIQMSDWRAFVLNKQTPNKQLWLSSPISGPQRYELADRSTDVWL